MQEQKENALLSPNEIIVRLVRWDNPENMREQLRDMFDSFFLLHDCPTAQWKNDVWGCWNELDQLLKSCNPLVQQIRKSEVL